ncbi:hypothetical protein B0H11DRAFT_2373514 [Mycena galericulata]|nr:hypothetical protein B0H11DRAFT_2373514 [Mycena galericulata]
MATFGPKFILGATIPTKDRAKFVAIWDDNVKKRKNTWVLKRKDQSRYLPQLLWESHVAEYVMFLHRATRSSTAVASLREAITLTRS